MPGDSGMTLGSPTIGMYIGWVKVTVFDKEGARLSLCDTSSVLPEVKGVGDHASSQNITQG